MALRIFATVGTLEFVQRITPKGNIKHQKLYLAKNLSWCLMMKENSKAKREKPRQPLYDEGEFTEMLEMVRGSRAYSKVRHDKHLTTGLMLRLQRTLVNKP